MADFSFFRAVKMGDRITPETVTWMRSFSKIVWIGIGILVVSGLGLFLLQPSVYLASAGFQAKMLFVGILIINGLFLNFYTTARLTTFNFSGTYTRRDAAWKARKLSFVFGAISTVSWYAALITAMFKDVVHLSFIEYLLLYLAALGMAISGALLLERRLHAKHLPRQATIAEMQAVGLAALPVATPPAPLASVGLTANAVSPPAPTPPPVDQSKNLDLIAINSQPIMQETTSDSTKS